MELLQNAKECYCCREIDNCIKFMGNVCSDSGPGEQNKEASLECIIDYSRFPATSYN